jgi:thiamine transport system permease protein
MKSRPGLPAWIKPILPWLGVSLFMGLFFFYPIVRILWLGLNPAAITSIAPSSIDLAVRSLLTSFYQAGLSTLLTLALGIPTAFLFSRYAFKGKALLRALTAIPFMLPTVVVAAGFNALLGPRGWINLGLMDLFHLQNAPITFVGTFAAILMAHVFYNTTIVIRLVGNALSSLDPRTEMAAQTLGSNPRQVLLHVTLPMLRPTILAASLLVFIFDFTSFGVILLLGKPGFSTLEVEIYRQAMQMFNLPLAGMLSLIQLLCTLGFSILYSRILKRNPVSSTPRSAVDNMRKTRTASQKILVSALVTFLLAFFLLPLVSLPVRSVTRLEADRGAHAQIHYGFTGDYYSELFINRRESLFYVPPLSAIGISMGYAALTVVLSLLIGFPVASALARPGRVERLLDPVLMLPLGASAVTLGLGFIITFNRPPLVLVTSPLLAPIAHTLIALPFVIRSLQPALASIPDQLKQAAAALGASPIRVWATVDWPIVGRATLSAGVFAFTISLGEFGATSLVVRPEYPTMPIAIARFLSQPGGMNYGQAMAMATILMVVCGLGILLIERMRLPGAGDF